MVRRIDDSTAWAVKWIVWDSLNRTLESSRDTAEPGKPGLRPFDSIDISTSVALATEGAVAAAEAVAALEKSRRLRWGTFARALAAAKSLAESAQELATAARVLAAGIPAADWEAIERSSDVRAIAALVCAQAISGQCGAEYSAIVLNGIIASFDEILGADMSDTARWWVRDVKQLTSCLSESAEESGQVAYMAANMLSVRETVAAATAPARYLARAARESEISGNDDALTEAMKSAGAEEAARTEELTRLAAEQSDFELSILSVLWSLSAANGACTAAMDEISAIDLERDYLIQVVWMIGFCALTTGVAHYGSLVSLILLRTKTLILDGQRLSWVARSAIVACTIGIACFTAVIGLVAGSVGAYGAAELIDEYEETWRERYPVLRILNMV